MNAEQLDMIIELIQSGLLTEDQVFDIFLQSKTNDYPEFKMETVETDLP